MYPSQWSCVSLFPKRRNADQMVSEEVALSNSVFYSQEISSGCQLLTFGLLFLRMASYFQLYASISVGLTILTGDVFVLAM